MVQIIARVSTRKLLSYFEMIEEGRGACASRDAGAAIFCLPYFFYEINLSCVFERLHILGITYITNQH